MSVNVEFSRNDDVWVCSINESIELFLVEELRALIVEAIERSGMTKVVFRMDNVPFIDSAGLGVFINLKYNFKDRVTFRFCGLRKSVYAVFTYTNFVSQFEIDDTLDASIEALGNGQIND